MDGQRQLGGGSGHPKLGGESFRERHLTDRSGGTLSLPFVPTGAKGNK